MTELLISGADLNRRNSWGASSLHAAAGEGFGGIVSTLLLRGADKDATSRTGDTPLILGSGPGHLSVVNILLAAGADASTQGMDMYSALDCAAFMGHFDVVESIVGHVAVMWTLNTARWPSAERLDKTKRMPSMPWSRQEPTSTGRT